MKKQIVLLVAAIVIALLALASLAEAKTKKTLPAIHEGLVIPSCTTGWVAISWMTDPTVIEWVATHPENACAKASRLYVCREGKDLSVRCD